MEVSSDGRKRKLAEKGMLGAGADRDQDLYKIRADDEQGQTSVLSCFVDQHLGAVPHEY